MKGAGLRDLGRDDWQKIYDMTVEAYSANEVDAGSDYYHMPQSSFYPSFFAWDSGFNAVAMMHVDPARAKRELETLFRHVAVDGHMPHEVLIPCAATRARPVRNFMRWLVQ